MNKSELDQVTTVGILLVHGIGEQLPGHHLRSVAESLVQVWQEKYGSSNVLEMREAPRKCDQCHSDECEGYRPDKCEVCCPDECVTILIKCGTGDDTSVRIEVREVFWADLDESPRGAGKTIMHQLRFWRWGLSQWANPRYSKDDTNLPGSKKMIEPVPQGESSIPLSVRLRLFGVSVAFILLGATWELLRFVVRRLRIAMAGSGVLVSHLGDVQLYTDDRYHYRPADVKLTDAPRDAVRRRMVGGLLKMALSRYDRWYVFAHSLGTVVAHNGLMELAEALPNYLSSKEWESAKKHSGLTITDSELQHRRMRPARPDQLDNTDAIDRGVLFQRLRGFCTYGSPLDKFAKIWPAIVPINPEVEPLARCDWINVFDQMDPVAASLDRFNWGKPFNPSNISYKASSLFVMAHISYLTQKTGDGFAAALGEWVVTGRPFDREFSGRFGGGDARAAARYLWWFGLSGVAALPWILLAHKFCDNCVQSVYHSVSAIAAGALNVIWHTIDLTALLCILGIVVALVLLTAFSTRNRSP